MCSEKLNFWFFLAYNGRGSRNCWCQVEEFLMKGGYLFIYFFDSKVQNSYVFINLAEEIILGHCIFRLPIQCRFCCTDLLCGSVWILNDWIPDFPRVFDIILFKVFLWKVEILMALLWGWPEHVAFSNFFSIKRGLVWITIGWLIWIHYIVFKSLSIGFTKKSNLWISRFIPFFEDLLRRFLLSSLAGYFIFIWTVC